MYSIKKPPEVFPKNNFNTFGCGIKSSFIKQSPTDNNFVLKKIIFPPLKNNNYHNLKIDNESIKYVTYHETAQQITNLIIQNLSDIPCTKSDLDNRWDLMEPNERAKELVITEMTSGIGGNVLNFAKHFRFVNAIEINSLRCEYLRNNIRTYNFSNVRCYNDDANKLLIDENSIYQDIVFFDPPWGGSGYKAHTKLKLRFGSDTEIKSMPIEQICSQLMTNLTTKMVVMKLPNNYDFKHLQSSLLAYRVGIHKLDRMTIVIIKN